MKNRKHIINFLKRWEGEVFHWNKTEKSATLPLGLYLKMAPSSAEPVKYAKTLFKKNGMNINSKRDVKEMNHKITKGELETLEDMIYDYYVDTYIDKKINAILDKRGFEKSKLTLFSDDMNAGKSRGVKILQKALDVGSDGKVGSHTLLALEHFNGTDDDLNKKMIYYLKHFYKGLASRSPKKYGIYLKGWMNRANALV